MNRGQVKAVREFLGGELGLRWFPLVWGGPYGFVKPEAWIEIRCPNGYRTGDEACRAALEYLHG